jgi:amidohydrolase
LRAIRKRRPAGYDQRTGVGIIEAETIGELVEDVKAEVIGWRRHLHRHPERSLEEVETSQFVYETLESFGSLKLSRPTETSVLARLIGEEPGRTIAIRADMDALPITEETGLPFASKNEGLMHACGHDGHTAILLGTAKVLGELKDHVRGEVRFIFQHAEEVGRGAEELVEAGVIEGVDAVIALHLVTRLEVGKVGIGYGVRSAAPDTFEIWVEGEGGHAAWPQNAVDPVVVSAQVVTNLQHIVSRESDPLESLVITVTRIAGGTTHNVIPGRVELKGTVRTLSEEIRKQVPVKMERIVRGITEAHGASYSFEYRRGPDSVVNVEDVTHVVEKTARQVFGDEAVEEVPPGMGSEDFSGYQRAAPTAFFSLGARNEAKGMTYSNHHPRFDIDEDALENGVNMFVHAAFGLLEVKTENGTQG